MKMTIQLIIAVMLVLAGLTLLFLGFFAPPPGEIDHSVLIAFGEICTFAGTIMGVDYSYRLKIRNKDERHNTDT
ncbi:MAG: hypothetical protein LBD53_01120 [Tannerella sp.]|jgi:hypothetical protein|nr:hypothetical protein [Tannerella sp.]